MTEAEWNACTDPMKMVKYLNRKVIATPRRLYLYTCAALRRFQAVSSVFDVLEVAGRYADGLATEEECVSACGKLDTYEPGPGMSLPVSLARNCLTNPLKRSGDRNAPTHYYDDALAAAFCSKAHGPAGTAILRDVFPTPFIRRLPRVLPSWRVGNALAVAEGISRNGDFERLPILADALEEAGCTDEVILSHCRGPGPHVRGCWVVDLLLGKE